MTMTTIVQGRMRHRPCRYGAMRDASAATSTAWPDTKLGPWRLTVPPSVDVGGDRGGWSGSEHNLFDHALESEFGDRREQEGEAEPYPSESEGDNCQEGSDQYGAELLKRPQHRVQSRRQVVHGAK